MGLWELRPKNRDEASCCLSCSGSGVGVEVGVWLCELSASACWLGDRRGLGTSTWATSSTDSLRYPSLPHTRFTPSNFRVVGLKPKWRTDRCEFKTINKHIIQRYAQCVRVPSFVGELGTVPRQTRAYGQQRGRLSVSDAAGGHADGQGQAVRLQAQRWGKQVRTIQNKAGRIMQNMQLSDRFQMCLPFAWASSSCRWWGGLYGAAPAANASDTNPSRNDREESTLETKQPHNSKSKLLLWSGGKGHLGRFCRISIKDVKCECLQVHHIFIILQSLPWQKKMTSLLLYVLKVIVTLFPAERYWTQLCLRHAKTAALKRLN